MISTDEHFVPSLRLRRSDHHALMHLKSPVKDQIIPPIYLHDIVLDFEYRQNN